MSQRQIADFTGLTPVHTCRVLSAMRKAGICEVGHGAVKVTDRLNCSASPRSNSRGAISSRSPRAGAW